MEERLKAILELDASDLQKNLIASSNELKKFERELAKSTDTNRIGELTSKISEAKIRINQMTKEMQGAGNATAKAGSSMGNASSAAMNFSRVIQDLPFGFMGIQNNLTQLIPGIGAAGIAFSALTAAITFSQVGLSYWTKKSKDAKQTADEFLSVTQEANKNAAQEIVNSRLLYQAATNAANSMDMRLRAAKELIKEWPQMFSNYSAEEIALGKAKKGYDNLTDSILKNARAIAAKNKISELEADVLNRLENIQKIKSITDKESATATKTVVYEGTGMAITRRIVSVEENRLIIQKRRNKAIAEENRLIGIAQSKQKFYEQFAGQTNLQTAVTPRPTQPKPIAPPKPQKENFQLSEYTQNKGKWWRESKTMMPEAPKLADTTQLRTQQNGALNSVLAEQSNIQTKLNGQMAAANQLAEYGGQVFGQMSMAMMQGGDIGEVLANSLKNIVSQLIQAVAQAALFAAIMSALNPGTSFGSFFGQGMAGGGGGGFMNIFGMISGQNIELSNQRTSTGMGFRRGRRG